LLLLGRQLEIHNIFTENKERYENALCEFYECVLLGGKKEN